MDNPGISKEAISALSDYSWPGNVREIKNTLQKALIFNRGAPVGPEEIAQAISNADLNTGKGFEFSERAIYKWAQEALTTKGAENLFESCMDRFAAILVGEALNLTGGNRSRAAKLLGLSRPTLHAKIDKYGLKFETSVSNPSSKT